MGRKLALLVGTSRYNDKKFPPLEKCKTDVEALAEVLRNPSIGAYEVDTLIDAPANKIEETVEKFFRKDKKSDDLLLLYITGHGERIRGKLYFVCKNTKAFQGSLLLATAISASSIRVSMDDCNAKQQVVIIDTCHAAAFIEGEKGEADIAEDAKRELLGQLGHGRVLLFAAGASESAWAGDKSTDTSLFTSFLIDGLKDGKAARGKDGEISVDEWFDYASEEMGKAKAKQTPRKYVEKEQGQIIIAKNPLWRPKPAASGDRGSRSRILEWLELLKPKETPSILHRKPLDRIIEDARQPEGWRYFVSQALRISLLLMSKLLVYSYTPHPVIIGLVLPFEGNKSAPMTKNAHDLPEVGQSLAGWLSATSFAVRLDDGPFFDYSTDYRLESLPSIASERKNEDALLEHALLIVPRSSHPLELPTELVEIVRRLLSLIYMNRETWRSSFDRNKAYQINFHFGADKTSVLTNLIERAIELGGEAENGKNRWRFCTLLKSGNRNLPVLQQTLTIETQTSGSPHTVKNTIPGQMVGPLTNLSMKAFQSGQVILLEDISPSAYPTSMESSTRSAVAVPIVDEDQMPAAVLYVASAISQAFDRGDLHILRVISRMMQEVLFPPQHDPVEISELIVNPMTVDTTFRSFRSEMDFIECLDSRLKEINESKLEAEQRAISVLSVSIDNFNAFSQRYGNPIARNLSQQIGLRIRELLVKFLDTFSSSDVFHIGASKYYIFLGSGLRKKSSSLKSGKSSLLMSSGSASGWETLDGLRSLARLLQEELSGTYRLSPNNTADGWHPVLPEAMLEVSNITVHIEIVYYQAWEIKELLSRYPPESTIMQVRDIIVGGIEARAS